MNEDCTRFASYVEFPDEGFQKLWDQQDAHKFKVVVQRTLSNAPRWRQQSIP